MYGSTYLSSKNTSIFIKNKNLNRKQKIINSSLLFLAREQGNKIH
jgi:hypothetical protein